LRNDVSYKANNYQKQQPAKLIDNKLSMAEALKGASVDIDSQ